jgi:hypothetical protein
MALPAGERRYSRARAYTSDDARNPREFINAHLPSFPGWWNRRAPSAAAKRHGI